MNIYCYLLPFKREHVFLDSGHRILMARLVQITTCVTILGRVRSNKNESDQTQEHIHTVRQGRARGYGRITRQNLMFQLPFWGQHFKPQIKKDG